ncbi:DNA-directed RNA pol I, largest subunit, partial [Kipferlia bialata]|eukprot:g3722.t1
MSFSFGHGQGEATASKVQFALLDRDELERASVCEITSTTLYNPDGVTPVENGLYDLRMGAATKTDVCRTCSHTLEKCPGHIGHISLQTPVFHP